MPPKLNPSLFKAARRKLRALSRRDSRPWFVTEYQLESPDLAELPAASDLPGLIFHHQFHADDKDHFIAYWESREDFAANQHPLERQLEPAKLQRATWARQLSVEEKPFWRRITPYGFLIHLVAALGALAALENYQAWLFAEPMVGLDIESIEEPINLSAGSHLYTYLLLTNQQANTAVRISDLRARLVGPQPSGFTPLARSHFLDKEGSLRLPLRTTALALPGRYRLDVTGRSRSGLLRGRKDLAFRRQVRVWSRTPEVELSLIPDTPTRSELRGLLHVGEEAASGLDCFVTLVREPGIRFGPLEFQGLQDWPDPAVARDGSASNQTWTTPPLRAFSDIRFTLFMEGRPVRDWHGVLREMTSECYARPKD